MSFATIEELMETRRKFYEAIDAGDEEAADEVLSHVKISPYIAQAAKAIYGRDGVELVSVFDFSDVKREFGDDWGSDVQ